MESAALEVAVWRPHPRSRAAASRVRVHRGRRNEDGRVISFGVCRCWRLGVKPRRSHEGPKLQEGEQCPVLAHTCNVWHTPG